ncbi:carbohydrate-binding protein [Streptomyces sp. TRM66268-LWL]|uniref:Carbohydrate-binding protein n=1 Tax=Streptomyces polyasparticus TaxID=2767826 RepID=A0ABR7SQE6_9ACTN|nr:carbohydrate-binding protein [Streptomyces polyasparticus]MBC9716548.1 carbohydrate-binding protein [Streptomyces polyasparticus]
MTTPGDNGARTPEEEDPFGYLYADGQAAGATPPPGGGGYGYPGRTSSYHQVRPVGERQYGQQAQAPQGYGQPQAQQSYGQAHYSAPETYQPADATRAIPSQGSSHGGGRGRGPNSKGLMIGAVAVVAAVVVGIGIAILGGDDGDKDPQAGSGGDTGATTGQSSKPSASADDKKDDEPLELPKTDAKVLQLTPPAAVASDVKGSKAGAYVAGFNQVGAALTWQIDSFEKAGSYSLRVRYGVPGEDTTGTLTVNGDRQTRPLMMKNYGAPAGDWEKGWFTTYAVVQLKKGTNVITLSCEQSDKCNANIDQMWLVEGTKG